MNSLFVLCLAVAAVAFTDAKAYAWNKRGGPIVGGPIIGGPIGGGMIGGGIIGGGIIGGPVILSCPQVPCQPYQRCVFTAGQGICVDDISQGPIMGGGCGNVCQYGTYPGSCSCRPNMIVGNIGQVLGNHGVIGVSNCNFMRCGALQTCSMMTGIPRCIPRSGYTSY